MRLVAVIALLVTLTSQTRAETRDVTHIDGEGRTYAATITIDDVTHHVTSICGIDCEGKPWAFDVIPFVVPSLDDLRGPSLHMISAQGFWFYLFFSYDGIASGIGRYGGHGTSYVYSLGESFQKNDATPSETPVYR